MEFRMRKRLYGSGVAMVTGILAAMLADVQTNHGISFAHAQWFSHQKSRADDHDVIK